MRDRANQQSETSAASREDACFPHDSVFPHTKRPPVSTDFSLAVYRDLLTAIKETGWRVFPLRDFFRAREKDAPFFVMRHDVDRRPEDALAMAHLEYALGVRSTYYFRVNRRVFREPIIRRIDGMGHEVGYHYEVMDRAHGDPRQAKRIFISELNRLRCLAEVTTACMHGSPLSRRDNRDFWRYFTPAEFGLLGEAYISVSGKDLWYATDTGRGWNRPSYNLKDRFPKGLLGNLPAVPSTWHLISMIQKREYKHIYLLTHPNRWSRTRGQWYRQWAEDACFNTIKAFLGACRRIRRAHHESPFDKPSLHDNG